MSRSRQVHVQKRVRSVSVNAWHLDNYFECLDLNRRTDVHTPSPSWKSNLPLFRHLSNPRDHNQNGLSGTPPEPFEHYSWALSDTLACFTGVTRYTARWSEQVDFHSVLVMAHIWMSLGSNLHTIHWESPLEKLHLLLLESPSIHFPVLKHLSLKLQRPVEQAHSDSERFRISLAPFVNRHSSTIRSLSFLGINPPSPPIDIISLLSMLDPLPCLQQFTLELGVLSGRYIHISDPLILTRFLSIHAATLEHLSLKFSGAGREDGQYHEVDDAFGAMFSAGLRNLVVLEIRHCGFSPLKGGIVKSARHFSDTITTLVIESESKFSLDLTYNEVERLVMAFSHRSSDARLTTLHLGVRTLSPQLIDLLAFALPGLRTLTLKARFIHANERWTETFPPPPDSFYPFRMEMEKRVYYNWELRHVSVRQANWNPSPRQVSYHDFSHAAAIIAERTRDAHAVPNNEEHPRI